VTVLSVVFVANWRSLRRVRFSSREIIPCVVCLNMIEEFHRGVLGLLEMSRRITLKVSVLNIMYLV
jgi:cytidine deaminase